MNRTLFYVVARIQFSDRDPWFWDSRGWTRVLHDAIHYRSLSDAQQEQQDLPNSVVMQLIVIEE